MLRDLTDFQTHVHPRRLAHLEVEVGLVIPPEPGCFYRDRVRARPESRQIVVTGLVGDGLPEEAGQRVAIGEAAAVLRASRAAVVASGTATLQAAVIGTPLVMVYRVAPLTAWIGRRLITTPHLALVNVVAGRRVVPELVQEQMTPERIAAEVGRLLTDERAASTMRADLARVRAALGEPGASARAAEATLEWLAQGARGG